MTPNSNSAEIFVQCTYHQVSSSYVYWFGSLTNEQTNKQTPVQTSNAQFAMVGTRLGNEWPADELMRLRVTRRVDKKQLTIVFSGTVVSEFDDGLRYEARSLSHVHYTSTDRQTDTRLTWCKSVGQFTAWSAAAVTDLLTHPCWNELTHVTHAQSVRTKRL